MPLMLSLTGWRLAQTAVLIPCSSVDCNTKTRDAHTNVLTMQLVAGHSDTDTACKARWDKSLC